MKKTPVFVGVAIIVLAAVVAVWWFWSLGNVPDDESPKTRLVIGQGTAFVTPSQGGPEQNASSGMDLKAGDVVRTGPASSASIMADGRADVRLDENSTVVLEKIEYPWGLGIAVRIKLQSGRVWSRLLKLIDADQSFEAATNDMVATVRGTAFGLVARNGTQNLLVDHGGLVVGRADGKKGVVGGQWFEVSADRRAQSGDIASSTWRDDSWVANQREADSRFSMSASKVLADRAAAGFGLSPDEWLYPVQAWSESLHLKFAGEGAPQLYGRYLGRKLYQVRDLTLRGKSGMAYHMMTEIEDEFGRLSTGVNGKAYRQWSRLGIGRMVLAMSDVPADDALYKIKLRLEEMLVGTWSDDDVQELYARSLGTDSRLDEAERLQCKSPADADRIRQAMGAAEQSLKRVESDAAKAQLDKERKAVLDDKLEIERIRLGVLDQRIKGCLAPAPTSTLPFGSVTSTTATSTTDVPPAATSTVSAKDQPTAKATSTAAKPPATQQDVTTQQALGLARIELFAQPNPANVGDRVTLYVKGYLSDGSTVDATAKATFSEIGGLGSLSGAVYSPAKSGAATLTATVQDGAQVLRANVSLQIGQAMNVLSALRISMAQGTTVFVGQSRRMTATAVYSSGYTQDVTSSVKFIADGAAGTVSGSTFVADKQLTGQVVVSASYTEGGITKSADLPINVIAGSLMQTVQ